MDRLLTALATLTVLVAIALTGTGPARAQEDAATTPLPGGASTLTETHGDWVVGCQIVSADNGQLRQCSISQRQMTQQGQQILSVGLGLHEEGGMAGTVVLPFGRYTSRAEETLWGNETTPTDSLSPLNINSHPYSSGNTSRP